MLSLDGEHVKKKSLHPQHFLFWYQINHTSFKTSSITVKIRLPLNILLQISKKGFCEIFYLIQIKFNITILMRII
jgi:hypothetical protein